MICLYDCRSHSQVQDLQAARSGTVFETSRRCWCRRRRQWHRAGIEVSTWHPTILGLCKSATAGAFGADLLGTRAEGSGCLYQDLQSSEQSDVSLQCRPQDSCAGWPTNVCSNFCSVTHSQSLKTFFLGGERLIWVLAKFVRFGPCRRSWDDGSEVCFGQRLDCQSFNFQHLCLYLVVVFWIFAM